MQIIEVDSDRVNIGDIGFSQENNDVQLHVELPEKLLGFDSYDVEFELENGNKSVLKNVKIKDNIIIVPLYQNVLEFGKLYFQIVAYKFDSDQKSKSNLYFGHVQRSINASDEIAIESGIVDQIYEEILTLKKEIASIEGMNEEEVYNLIKKYLKETSIEGILTEEQMQDFIANTEARHTHSNKELLDSITEEILKGISIVHELPKNAINGDMCLYSPANTITPEMSGKRIYFDWDEFSRPSESDPPALDIQCNDNDYLNSFVINGERSSESGYISIESASDDYYDALYVSYENGALVEAARTTHKPGENEERTEYTSIEELPKYFNLPEFDEVNIGETTDAPLFYTPYRLMIYQGGEWQNVEEVSDVNNDTEFLTKEDLEYVTPQMFGAVADGETDDTEAVQAALDNGGIIYFPAGVYKVTKQLTTTKPCVIKMFKPYPSQFWRSGATSGRYDYPIKIAEGESDYETEKGWNFGARIECYPSEDEQYGLLIGDGCEVDGLFMRAMDGFSGTLLAYDNSHEYGTDNLGDPITYSSYPSAARFKHIRLDCDRHHTETTIPESMFDFYPHGKYFYIFDDIVIGHQNEFATYGFRSIIDEEATWANSVRITNLCIDGLFDYPLYIVEENTNHSLTNWIFEGMTIQTYGYTYNEFEQAREGHKTVMTLKRMNYCLFNGCYIWDLYAAKYVKLFDCENLNNISCVGCSEEFYYGTKKLVGDDGEEGIETVLKDRLQEVADDANVKTLTMNTTTMADGSNRIELADNHGNIVGTDIPAVSLSDEQVSTGVDNWMTENANPVEQIGRNKLNIYSDDMLFGYTLGTTGKPGQYTDVARKYAISHYIPAKKDDVFRMGTGGKMCNWSDIVEYDKDYNFLKYHRYNDTDIITPGWIVTLTDENTAYIRVCWNLGQICGTEEENSDPEFQVNLEVAERGKFCVTLNDSDISYEPYGMELIGGLASYFKLQSPNGTHYSVAVTDDGVIVGKDENGNIVGSAIPVKTSQLENDSGFITADNIDETLGIPTKVSELENDVGFITAEDIPENGDVDLTDYYTKQEIDDRYTTQAENEEPTYSEELATVEGWTIDGWTGDFANGFTHTTGNTTPLVFTMPEDTAQNTYRISFRCSESIAVEALMVRCGGSDLFDLYGQSYNPVTLGIVSVENGNLEFVPASTFKGTITDISIKRVVGFNPTKQTITDSTGEISCEMRTTKSSLDNVFIGKHSGENNTSGRGCSAVGSSALQNNTSGFWNVGIGHNALKDNTVGSRNVAIGYIALAKNVTGIRNVAVGSFALNHNKTGNKNIAIGADSLDHNISGSFNIGIGLQTLYSNVSGNYNTAIGAIALAATTGNNNTAVGYSALTKVTTGNNNTGLGYCAGYNITTGANNFALGTNALYKLKTGSGNIGIGIQSGRGQGTTTGFKQGIFIGSETGYSLCDNADYNILIGSFAGHAITTGARNIIIGENLETPTPTTSYWVNVGGLYEGSRNTADKYAKINGGLQLSDIPTTDPAITGRVWNDNGILRISSSDTQSNTIITLPKVTEADNGKILMVVNGKWEAVNVEGLNIVNTNEEVPLSETY